MCRVFISTIVLYFISVLCVHSQQSLSQNVLKLNEKNWSVINDIEQLKYTFSSSNNECSRYCIEPLQDRVIKHVVIIWNIVQDELLVFNDELVESNNATDNITNPMKCIFYVNIGCETSTYTDGTIDDFIEYSKLERSIDNNNEKIFIVDHETENLKVTIAEEKNTSSLLLDIPLEWRRIENNDVLELSLMRKIIGNNLLVTMINPSAGKWRLKLIGIETTNSIGSIYNNHNIMGMKNFTMPIMTPKRVHIPQQLQSRSADAFKINANENDDTVKVSNRTKIVNKFARIVSTNHNNEMIINENNDVLNVLMHATNGIAYKIKTTMVDLAPETTLIVSPGTVHPIIFTIRNYLPSYVFYTFRASQSELPIIQIIRPDRWIKPGEIFQVAVVIQIPNVNENIVKTVTLDVEHGSNFEYITKSAYVYVQNPNTMITDYTKPSIYFSFNDNCAGKLSQDRCDDSEWSTEITVNDNESGVKIVVSQPDGIRPKKNFIAGIKGSVNFQYRSTCCYTTVQITAIDVVGNSYTREIDVTAWDNLMVGDIAAIIIGALFLLFIIILLILLCIYCVRRRKSKDISFTQRYGSNPRAERTNF